MSYSPEGQPLLPEQATLEGMLGLIDQRVGRVIPYPGSWQQAYYTTRDEQDAALWLLITQAPLEQRSGYGRIAMVKTFPRPPAIVHGNGESTEYTFYRDESGLRLQEHIPLYSDELTEEGALEELMGGLDINAEVRRRRTRDAEHEHQDFATGLGRVYRDETGHVETLIRNARFQVKPRSTIMAALIGERPYAPKLYPPHNPILRLLLGLGRDSEDS